MYLEVVVRHRPVIFGGYKDVITDDVHDSHYDRIEYRIWGYTPQGMITHPYNFIIFTYYTTLLSLTSLSDPVLSKPRAKYIYILFTLFTQTTTR